MIFFYYVQLFAFQMSTWEVLDWVWRHKKTRAFIRVYLTSVCPFLPNKTSWKRKEREKSAPTQPLIAIHSLMIRQKEEVSLWCSAGLWALICTASKRTYMHQYCYDRAPSKRPFRDNLIGLNPRVTTSFMTSCFEWSARDQIIKRNWFWLRAQFANCNSYLMQSNLWDRGAQKNI